MSVIALAGDVMTLFVLTHALNVHYLVSAVLAFAVGLFINYELSIHWVFSRRSVRNQRRELAIFCGVGIAGAGINEALLWLGAGVFGRPLLAAKALSVGVVFFWNYGLRKWLLFS